MSTGGTIPAGADGRLTNPDLALTSAAQRTWTLWNIAALWVGMAVCITTYNLASRAINAGMSWWQALGTIALGNLIVLVPMILNAHAGARYGIPFPVFARAPFGVLGANIAALLRALVACGWFGIQTWIGGWAIYTLARAIHPASLGLPQLLPAWLGLGTGPFVAFLIFWAMNLYFIWKGTESIRWLETLSAPFLILLGLALFAWAYLSAGGLGPMLSQPDQFGAGDAHEGEFWTTFLPYLTSNVAYWATLSLNISDFTRYARSQRDQVVGQAIGLAPTMVLYAFIGVAVTSVTPLLFHRVIWDPIELLAQFRSVPLVAISLVGLLVATLTTNIAANVVSPANDFSNLAPQRISHRTGGLITAVVGILILPWKLYNDPRGYIFSWLIAYAAVLAPIGGILMTDYYLVRRKELVVEDLYRRGGRYEYRGGYNWRAIVALVAGIVPSVPGFLVEVKVLPAQSVAFGVKLLYDGAWFVGVGVAGILYYALMRWLPPAETATKD